jgi:hypothetical protein
MSLVNVNTVSFDSRDLATYVNGLSVLASNPYQPGKRNVVGYNIARTDKVKNDSAFWGGRVVTVHIGITRATRDLAESSFDTLMSYIQGREKDLILKQSGATRRFVATLSDIVWSESGGAYLEFDLVFECSDAFGYDVAYTQLLQVNAYVSANKTDLLGGSNGIGGSARTQVPLITLTYTSVTGGTSATVYIGNDTTGQRIAITRTWVTGDVLTIDACGIDNSGATKLSPTVKVNSVEVAFTGAIPEWAPGVGYISYADTFTNRIMGLNVKHYQRWV